jgi:predicted DNA-binding protein (UPF0251 family)/predicted Fe-Mo cluster-binding NifX family protein
MRPKSCRRVGSQPDVTYFKPRGIPLSSLEEVVLSVDEFETLRLADHEGLYHEEAAVRMGVSRPTFGRVLSSARRKVADALVGGKALRIEGGKVEMTETVIPTKQGGKMNIAVSTADGRTICGHLGKCRTFIIYETDGKEIKKRHMRATGGACPGHGKESQGHAHNVSPFEGCHAVITQGMGQGLLSGLAQAGIQPVITDQTDPDTAVRLFLDGALQGTSTSSCVCGEHGH